MMNSARIFVFLLLVVSLSVVAEGSEYMLFSPSPLEGELLVPERGKGVLVRRITLKPGDTLSQISRDYSGRGSYFPQILLFNNIQNPDRIRAGKELLVPVSKQDSLSKTSAPEKKISKPTVKTSSEIEANTAKSAVPAEKTRRKSADKVVQKKQAPTEQLKNKGEQYYYSMALSAYRKEDYKKSLSLFGRFLELYPSSSLAPDASLYKAESLLKLSTQ